MAETISGITIPDSKLAQEATELVREFASELIYDHSRRVYIFGALRGEQDGIAYDPELFLFLHYSLEYNVSHTQISQY